FGVMICADRRWPETVRSLALQGARVIFNPTYGMYGEQNLWLMRTRSYESEVFIAFTHPLEALLTGPEGEVVVDETREEIPFSVTEIDLTAVDQRRARESSHLKDRRTELYTL
ncbi:MAG: carbon-nitrogen hydrolase family protein, partial [Chloroflexi bacterium]|nr:carbon-nitrogen hydrolase family protein [Chloroflexota bacterium]